jgi:cytochrome c-type biogenesis protein CcmH/NrfG
VSFWRKDIIEFALDQETLRHIKEQRAWIEREPNNAEPYHNLAQLYRTQGKQDEALGLLLEAVRLDGASAKVHTALAEIYAVRGDMRAAWNHAHAAERNGDRRAVQLLERYGAAE